MSKRKKSRDQKNAEVIAAFDRERDEAHELRRRHSELVNNSRRRDRPALPKTDLHHP
jgi:hypothetical protein